MNARSRLSSIGLWLAAAIAFSPGLVALVRQSLSVPRSATAAVAALLLLLGAFRDRSRTIPRRRLGAILLAAGSALELLGIVGGASTLACASLPVAIVGAALLLGHPLLRIALLSAWLVPIPVSLVETMREALEQAMAAGMAGLLRLTGHDALAVGPLVRAGAQTFELGPRDAGLHLAHLLSLLAWYGGALRRESLPRLARRSALAALLALPIQAIFLAAAALLLVTSGAASARGLLDVGLPALAAITALVWAERR